MVDYLTVLIAAFLLTMECTHTSGANTKPSTTAAFVGVNFALDLQLKPLAKSTAVRIMTSSRLFIHVLYAAMTIDHGRPILSPRQVSREPNSSLITRST